MRNVEHEMVANYPGIFAYREGKIMPFQVDSDLPWRIRNRLLLHQIGACQMFTAILPPDPCCVDSSDFRDLAKLASSVNGRIGLPREVNDLVVRTRDATETTRMAGNNPILRILNVRSEKPRFIQMKSQTDVAKEFYDFQSWQATLEAPMFCMIHEDNPNLQMKSIHGRVMRFNHDAYVWELSLGTQVLHARMIGDKDSKYVGMVGHDLSWLIENAVAGNLMGVANASSDQDARYLAGKMEGYQDNLREIYSQVEDRVGPNVVLEFRLYPNSAGLQVYDFDKKF